MRLDPLHKEIQQKGSMLDGQREDLKGEKSKPENEPETNPGFAEDLWLRKEKITE
jgi:hypothetical protein